MRRGERAGRRARQKQSPSEQRENKDLGISGFRDRAVGVCRKAEAARWQFGLKKGEGAGQEQMLGVS